MKAKPYFDFNEVSRKGIEVSNVKLIEYTWNQLAFTYSKLTIETLEQGVKCVQS